jgi:PAS domain S-box-containing protein
MCASQSDSRSIHRKARKALKRKDTKLTDQSTKLLELAEQVAHFGSWELDLSKTRANWSPGMFRVFGVEPRKNGFKWEEYASFIHPDDLASANENVQIMLNSPLNHRESFDYRIIQRDGSVHVIRSQRQVIGVDAEGKAKVVVGVDQDVTEQKQTEEKIQQYSKHLEDLVEERTRQLQEKERLAAIGQTAGMVGHDIRNPLQAITGDLYLISEELKENPQCSHLQGVQESLSAIAENIFYINKIVSDLQDYTRPIAPNKTDTNLKALLDMVVAAVKIPQRIKAQVIAAPELTIVTDQDYLRRILTNLLLNAIQAIPNAGSITVGAVKRKDRTVITVKDDGVGVAKEARDKLFTPLFTTKAKGQGLGLAVVKRLVEGLNGRVSVESQEGKGTKFTIELPHLRKQFDR